MQKLRELVARKLEALPASSGPARPREDVERLSERVREMIQDATAKGERLSAAGERSSRAAESLLRSLETETREMEGLVARLVPVTEQLAEGSPGPADPSEAGPVNGGLRLLSENDLMPDFPEEPGTMPEAGRETR